METEAPTGHVERKLTAILSTDVVGYSRLMGDDEPGTVQAIKACRKVMRTLIEDFNGRVVDSPGDNLLAEFSSVVDATECAVSIQKKLKERNDPLPENRRMTFRIGINLGDVIKEGDQIYGEGVNIAARLEGMAEAGGICISGVAFDQVKHKTRLGFEYLGRQEIKNIRDKIRIYRVLMDPASADTLIFKRRRDNPRHRRIMTMGTVGILVLVAVLWIAQKYYFNQSPSSGPVPFRAEQRINRPSLAVLPFTNMSEDHNEEYFSDGITEDLITDLSKVSGLLVISRTSVFTYKGKSVKVKEVEKPVKSAFDSY